MSEVKELLEKAKDASRSLESYYCVDIELFDQALAECDAVCEWKNDKTYSFVYITSCGYRTRIYKPSDERVKFCPFCGHKIKEVK